MPFDLTNAVTRLRQVHGTGQPLRNAMLELLFTTGLPVREQAFALSHGDVLCMETCGPAAPSLEPPRVFVLVDLIPPHLASVAKILDEPAQWAAPLQSLGGPTVAAAWTATLHSLTLDESRRPWRLLYVQGPAMGTSEAMRSLIGGVESDAELIVILPSVLEDGLTGQTSVIQLDLTRSRNVWRFPACHHSYAIDGEVPFEDEAVALNGLIEGLDSGGAWTLHDLHIYPSETIRFSAILRSAEPMDLDVQGFTQRDIAESERLMFPINDAMGVLLTLAEQLAGLWGDALRQPLHFRVLPDGARVYALIPAGTDWASVLPERIGAISVEAQESVLSTDLQGEISALALDDSDRLGPCPAGLEPSAVWRVPTLTSNTDLAGFARALRHKLSAEA
ncbi:MAG TPA: hypothetical protein DCQ06_04790 [Myxococcales bacterium]|nr:hypothetical protein [Myxococcales bacterium]